MSLSLEFKYAELQKTHALLAKLTESEAVEGIALNRIRTGLV
jgi:hypothetical protein